MTQSRSPRSPRLLGASSRWLNRTLVAGVFAGSLAACGDEEIKDTGDVPLDTWLGGSDISDTTDGSDSGPGDTGNPNAVRSFHFVDDRGDDGNACGTTTDRCAIFVGYSEQLPLRVKYLEDGLAKADHAVAFEIINDPNSVGRILALNTTTDADGMAQTSVTPRSDTTGQFVVKVTMPGKPDVAPLYFDVVISPKGVVPLTVLANYNGTRPVGTFNAYLYRQDQAGQPNCSNPLNLLANETAVLSRDNVLLASTAKFPEFPNLANDGTQKYTIVAYSTNSSNAIQAIGCNDTDGTVSIESSNSVLIELDDRAPQYRGAYEITSQFDFISAIPEPYRTYVNYVVDFFRSPTQAIGNIACNLMRSDDQQLNGFCDALFDIDSEGNVVAGTLGSVIFNTADDILNSLIAGTTFATILQSGGDVASILKVFEIKATFTVSAEPDSEGVFAPGSFQENWHSVRVKWTLGQNCDPVTDQGCGVRDFNITALQGQQAVRGNVPARIQDFYTLHVDQHPLNIRYGALIDYFMQAFLLPAVTGRPTIDTYQEFLGYLVGGNDQCLSPAAGQPDCCNSFSTRIGLNSGDTSHTAVTAACNAILNLAPNYLSSTLAGLDLSTGETFNIGTKTQGCLLRDTNDDMVIDQIGSQSNPCQWNVVLRFSDSASTTIDSKFWGSRGN